MVPKKSRFFPKGPNFAIVASFRAKSRIPNPVSERLQMYCSLIPDKQAQAVRENPLLSCPAELVLTRSPSGVPPITADWSPVRHHSLKLPADRNTPRIAMKTTLALLLASALMAGVSGRGPLVKFPDRRPTTGFWLPRSTTDKSFWD